VFRDTAITRATSEIDTRSDRHNRRISAQSSTLNTRFLPGSTEHRVPGKLVNFRLPRGGQFSPAVDMVIGAAPFLGMKPLLGWYAPWFFVCCFDAVTENSEGKA